jgi:hypothetical protein
VVRELLEDQHPDGLDGDDVRAALEGCVDWAAAPPLVAGGAEQPPQAPPTRVDPEVLVAVLVGALGVHPDDEDAPRPGPEAFARNGSVLIAYLLGRKPSAPAAAYLTRAFGEIADRERSDGP